MLLCANSNPRFPYSFVVKNLQFQKPLKTEEKKRDKKMKIITHRQQILQSLLLFQH